MVNLAHMNTQNAGLHFSYTNIPKNDENKNLYRTSVISKCSIVESPGYAVNGY